VGVILGVELEGQVGGGEGGDVVLVWIGGGDLVLASVEQVEAEVLRAGVSRVEYESLVGGGDVGICRLGEIGEEDVVPGGGSARGNVLDVEDVVLEVFVEDAGLNLEGGLRGWWRRAVRSRER
jgi:hypothetical protein